LYPPLLWRGRIKVGEEIKKKRRIKEREVFLISDFPKCYGLMHFNLTICFVFVNIIV